MNSPNVISGQTFDLRSPQSQRPNEERRRKTANKVLGSFELRPVKRIARELTQTGVVKILVPIDGPPEFVQPSLGRDGRVRVVSEDVKAREVIWYLQGTVLALEDFALVRLQLVLQSLLPL